MSTDIKIFTSYHKKCELLSSKYIYPIQVGTEKNGQVYPHTLHDNTGENISAKNGMYCELTAQYWAWKNVTAEYYGFMHYRRYFCFNTSSLEEDSFGNVLFSQIDDAAIKRLNINDATIEAVVPRYDVICTRPQKISSLNQGKTVWEHYKNSPHHRIKDLEIVLDIICEKYPEYLDAAQEYMNSEKGYFCNMYILKKDIFDAYSAWLFDILDEHEKRTDFSSYNIDEYRVSGFLAERLWGIYYTWLKSNNKTLKCKEIQRSFFKSTDEKICVTPAYNENQIPIVIAADNNYVPYVTVMLRSLICNASKKYNYDLIVLNSNIEPDNQRAIISQFKNETNLSIRFVNVFNLLSDRSLFVHRHFTIEIYYRLLMQDIMKAYDKVLYLDSDLIILDDISKLYNVDIGDAYVGAVVDVDFAGCYNGGDPERKKYFSKNLKMDSPFHYFNSGVLLMNLVQFRENFTSKQILDIAESKEWLFPDQDVLNILCENHVYYLDMAWNVMMNWKNSISCRIEVAKKAPHHMFNNYMKSRENVKIAHFAGFQKPWNVPDCDFANQFWKYARNTAVYETLLCKCSTHNVLAPQQAVMHSMNDDPYQLKIPGMEETLYIDGVYVKMLNKLNRWFPMGSKRRAFMKKIAKLLFR